jgi:D-aspartate ligase
MQENKRIIPVLLGGDLNAYSVALAFRSALGVTSHAFCRYRCGATESSRFIKTHIVPELDNLWVMVDTLAAFAAKNSGAELYLIPCGDAYVELTEQLRPAFASRYKIHIPERYMWYELTDKWSFYKKMREQGIPCPKTVLFSCVEDITDNKLTEVIYPAVIKPSRSAEYWKHPFPDMQKVYFPKNKNEAASIIKKIFGSGYKSGVILQKYIGSDDKNRVLTTFSDSEGRVVRAVLGDVILEECGRTARGNHAAIITAPLDKTAFKLIDFLNSVSYRGIANFDIMCHEGEMYVLEINTRQGRSSDYLRAAGVNIAELLCKTARGERIKTDFFHKEVYWHYPPHRVVMKYASTQNALRAQRLYEAGQSYTPYANAFEGAGRKMYVALHKIRQYQGLSRGKVSYGNGVGK